MIMGMVSNLGAAVILLRLPKTSNTITNWLTIISGLVFGAIGVGYAGQLLATELKDTRLFLHRDNAQADDVAQIAQAAPGAG